MNRVTGLGGIFFQSDNAENLYPWHEKYLGIIRSPDGSDVAFHRRDAADPQEKGMTVWSVFPPGSKFFDPSPSPS